VGADELDQHTLESVGDMNDEAILVASNVEDP